MQKISIPGIEMLTRAFREMMRVKRADAVVKLWIDVRRNQVRANPPRAGIGGQWLSGGTGVLILYGPSQLSLHMV
jgi:hypothetical protein